MRHQFEGEVQRQRTEEEAKVEGIRRQANQVLQISFQFVFLFSNQSLFLFRQQNSFFTIKHSVFKMKMFDYEQVYKTLLKNDKN